MTRNELFQYITENNLKEDVKKAFKKAYNSVSTLELNKFVENHMNLNKEKEQPKVTSHPSLSRNECFDVIKTCHHEAEIKALYKKPYNKVSTDKLNEFLKTKQVEEDITEEGRNLETCLNEASVIKKDTKANYGIDLGARKVLTALCTTLNMKELLKNLK